MKGRGEKQEPWLLIKEKDAFARPAAEFSVVDEEPDSVKDLDQVHGKRADLPASLAPQLATLVEQPPASPQDWIFEVKFDGYRLLARVHGKHVRLFTRNGHDWSARLPDLHAELRALKLPEGWYDGEIVVNDAQGRPNFGLLQQAFEGGGQILYYLFDLPYHDGEDCRALPLEMRRSRLRDILAAHPSDTVRLSEEIGADPATLLAAACQMGLEGLIAKRRDAHYVQRRSRDWVKLKCGQRQEFVIGGYTDPQGARVGLGSLLLGVYDEEGALRYAGNVGTGFDDAGLRSLLTALQSHASDSSPFTPAKVAGRKPHWVKPVLVAEVRFAEWTHSGSVRHAVFVGLRKDKRANTIRREQAAEAPAPADAPVVSHGERVIDAGSGITKLELNRYYALVAELMLPHLKGRPLALVRAPAGVKGQLFFQKHAEVDKLPGVQQLDPELDAGHPAMLAISKTEGIVSAAQWNVVEFHTQNADASNYEQPNRLVFDLDPGEGVGWAQVREAALLLQALLVELGLVPFLKTSGGKGLHLVVPLRRGLGWDAVKDFSRAVVEHMAQTLPQHFALKSGPRNRVGKIFIDYLRNGRGATTACAWSARARPGLGISVPLAWDELDHVKAGDQWNIRNVHSRLDRGNAVWDGYSKGARSLGAALKRLGRDVS